MNFKKKNRKIKEAISVAKKNVDLLLTIRQVSFCPKDIQFQIDEIISQIQKK